MISRIAFAAAFATAWVALARPVDVLNLLSKRVPVVILADDLNNRYHPIRYLPIRTFRGPDADDLVRVCAETSLSKAVIVGDELCQAAPQDGPPPGDDKPEATHN